MLQRRPMVSGMRRPRSSWRATAVPASPMVVYSPSTTPDDRRPSILQGPSEPELRETKPSRSTVVPGAR